MGNNIKIFREKMKITLYELSNLTGISVGYLCHLENGTRDNPSYKIMTRIAKALNKTINDIFN